MLWKIYLWIWVAIVAMAQGMVLAAEPAVWDWMDLVTSMVSAVGLVGFAYAIPIGRRAFWRLWAFVPPIWDGIYNVVLSSHLGWAQKGAADAGPGAYLVGLPILVPLYVALFLYGYRRTALWRRTAGADEPLRFE